MALTLVPEPHDIDQPHIGFVVSKPCSRSIRSNIYIPMRSASIGHWVFNGRFMATASDTASVLSAALPVAGEVRVFGEAEAVHATS